MNDIQVSVIPGPTVYNPDTLTPMSYISIGIKYNSEVIKLEYEEILEDIVLNVKNEILKLKEQKIESEKNNNFVDENYGGIITLTDKFFEYLKNNDTKINAIRVSLDDYSQDYKEQKLRTLKTKMMVITADEQSINDAFDTIVKQLYYEFGDKVIDLYSIILTPKMYKIINNIPVEYRSVLIRVKK